MNSKGKVLQKSLAMILVLLLLVGCSKKESATSDALYSESKTKMDVVYSEEPLMEMSEEQSPAAKEMIAPLVTMDAQVNSLVEAPSITPEVSGENYTQIVENMFQNTSDQPLTTFSVDVDTAGYSNMRRFIMGGTLPPVEAVRIEEMLNYFTYDYEKPTGDVPFSIQLEHGVCPWQSDQGIVMIGLQGKEIQMDQRANTNLVFLLDVSGSMEDYDKLPLLKEAFKLLTNQLTEADRVSIVVYAGASGIVLDGARGNQTEEIINALDRLSAGGSTAGGEGILQAYELAEKYFMENGNNRVILATDGDFNVGVYDSNGLEALITEKREAGVFLSVLGFGQGNTQFSTMELLADKGNGQFAYIDSQMEAEKVMVQQMTGTLYTIAKDVKIQVAFNPEIVKSYRLLGYENRMLNNEDFTDDKKDAGEIGAGHTVTALYQVQYTDAAMAASARGEIANVKLRYKEPTAAVSQEIHRVLMGVATEKNTTNNFLFATSVAEFGLLLRDSEFKGNAAFGNLINRLETQVDLNDTYKQEFKELVLQANAMIRQND